MLMKTSFFMFVIIEFGNTKENNVLPVVNSAMKDSGENLSPYQSKLRLIRQAPQGGPNPSIGGRQPRESQGGQEPPPQEQTTGGPVPIDSSYRGTICEASCSCQEQQINCKQRGYRKLPDLPWPPHTQAISFEENDFTSLPANMFNRQSYRSLRLIAFTSNQIKKIKADTFTGLPNVVELRLDLNKISSLEPGAFSGLKALELLLLNNNKLKKIDPVNKFALFLLEYNKVDSNNQIFVPTKDIAELNLNDNLLQALPAEMFDHLPKLRKLNIAGNLWKCDCELLGIFVWVGPGREIKGQPRCSNPEEFIGKVLLSFSYKEVQDMCYDPSEEEDDDSPASKKERELKKINETCDEHTSSDPVHICYISKDVEAVPGEEICVYCVGTAEGDDDDELPKNSNSNPNPEEFFDLKISWGFSDRVNFSNAKRISEHKNGTLCFDEIEAADSGKYTCTVKWKNFTETDSLTITVTSLTIQVAIGIAIGVVALFFITSGLLFRWWFIEANAGETPRVVPTDILKY